MDTATPVTSVAVGSGVGVLAAMAARNERAHAELLVPMVRQVLERAGIDQRELAAIAVGTGPGLFTGLRVGISSAKALAQAWRLPIVAVPSLDLLAFACRHARRLVCAVIDGRRGELFSAIYRPAGTGIERIGEHRVQRPDQLAAELEALGGPVLLCGDGALRSAAAFERLGKTVEVAGVDHAAPSAESLIQLALQLLERGEVTQPLDVHPLYLRRPDVDPSIERRLAAERAAGGSPGMVGAAFTGT
jgi:tRNA threonylcarbamoyladenosine biosynthesis protein TsaB